MATQLTQLQEIVRLSKSVIRILGANPGKFTLQGSNTYLVGTGHERILIDTGEGKAAWLSSLKSCLKSENAIISVALITHWHHDHIGGIADLLSLSPSTKVHKHQPSTNQLDIADSQVFRVDGASLRAVFSPGHTHDHMALYFEDEDALFTGDNVLGHGTAVFEDLHAYLNSLEKMRGVFKGRAYPGHGDVVPNGPAKIQEYIQHRQLRENQVLSVLKSMKDGKGEGEGDWSSMEIVKVIYKDVVESLHVPANGGIVQILDKLLREEKVVSDYGDGEGRWRIKDRAAL